MCLQAILKGSSGFRAVSNVFSVIKDIYSWFIAPAHSTIRQWLLKLGLFKLNRPKDKDKKWIFIVDASIQMGSQKCLMVIGLPVNCLTNGFSPTFDQLEPLVMKTVAHTPGEVVRDALVEASKKVGEVAAIVSDEGGEMKKGLRLLAEETPSTVGLVDIAHKVNTILKRELKDDEVWKEFLDAATMTIQNLKLTPLAHLVPPRQRQKARLLSQIHLVDWGCRLLAYLQSEEGARIDPQYVGKVEWIQQMEEALEGYRQLIEACKAAIELVHRKGYYRGIDREFSTTINRQLLLSLRSRTFVDRITSFLQEQGEKVPLGEAYLGSSEVIESLFGKFKHLEQHHASSGLTSLVLAIPALVGPTTKAIVEETLSTVRVADITEWIDENLGQTYLSKRRQCLTRVNSKFNLDQCDFELCTG